MAIIDNKILTPITNVQNLARKPTPDILTYQQLQAVFDAGPEALRVKLNALIDGIMADYETQLDLTNARKLSATGDFTGTLNGGAIMASGPGLQATVVQHLADIAAHGTMARQTIINGNFDIWQRGINFVNALGSVADRWKVSQTADGGTMPNITISKQPVLNEELLNSVAYLRVHCDGSGSAFGTNAIYQIGQPIENGAKLLAGSNKKITISFMARSSIPNKKIGVYGLQNYGTGGTPSILEVVKGSSFTLTASFQKFTCTIPLNSLNGKTFGTNNDDYITMFFVPVWGVTSGLNTLNNSISESFISAGDIDIAQVQINTGDIALPFTPKNIVTELRDCMRYCFVLAELSSSFLIGYGLAYSTTTALIGVDFPVQMRVPPTLVAIATDWQVADGVTITNATAISIFVPHNAKTKTSLSLTVAGGLTQFRTMYLQSKFGGNVLIFDAEL